VGRAVESILKQTFTDFEIVVVDNNPTNLQIARSPKEVPWLADSRVRLVQDETPHNAASVRNLGLAVARGQWVTYLDDDDAYHPEKLGRQLCAGDSSGLPLGVCGMVRHLPGRRRLVNWEADEIRGDDLLLYFPGMPTIFHRQAADVRFDESLNAGEDQHYFQRLLRYYRASKIFNVPQALVKVYQQATSHVNLNGRGIWESGEAILREFGTGYSETARRLFRERARMHFCKLDHGHLRELMALCVLLVLRHGMRDTRLILNCLLYKFPWMRPWLVN
jgi:glycosyltransferase involved in cell wall biosynthesis